MLNIPAAVQTLFKTDGVPKQFRVHFPNGERADITNDRIVNGSVKFTESVCSKDVLQFGLAEASEIQFECVGVENIYGMTIQCAIEIEVGEADGEDTDDTLSWLTPQYVEYSGKKYYRIPYGEFIVESCPRKQGAMKHRRVRGYGGTALDDINVNDMLYNVMPYSNFRMSFGLLEALMDNSLFTIEEIPHTSSGEDWTGYISWAGSYGELYDADGKAIRLEVDGSEYCRTRTGASGVYAIYSEYETDLELYEQNGMAIAKALDDAGYNVTYNQKKKKVYSSNEAALRAVRPDLFCPCVKDVFPHYSENYQDGYGYDKQYNANTFFALKSGEIILAPIIYGGALQGKMPNVAYDPLNDDTFIQNRYIFAFSPIRAGVLKNTFAYKKFRVNNGTYTQESSTTVSYTPKQYTFHFNTVKRLVAPESDIYIKAFPTLIIRNRLIFGGWDENVSNPKLLGKSFDCYTYSNSISIKQLILGMYELRAKFGKVSRDGTVNSVGLSKNNPIAVSKSEYEELWWDEYSVDSIGSVIYSFGRDEEQYEYVFGDGLSIYDMTENYLLKKLEIPQSVENPTDYINSLIDEYFVPNVQDVSFTPVDLNANGLPYLEAGDYLVIDNDDGGTVGTYILERSISGVHSLEDSIESQGGEIIGSDVRSI